MKYNARVVCAVVVSKVVLRIFRSLALHKTRFQVLELVSLTWGVEWGHSLTQK